MDRTINFDESINEIVKRIKWLKMSFLYDEEKLQEMAMFDSVISPKIENIGIQYLDTIVGMVYLGYPDDEIKYYINIRHEQDAKEAETEQKRRISDDFNRGKLQ